METREQTTQKEPPKVLARLKANVRRFFSSSQPKPEYILPSILYDFPLFRDPVFNSSPEKSALEALNIKAQTIRITEEAMLDLETPESVQIITKYSTNPEDQTATYTQSGIGAVVLSPNEVHFHIDPTNPNTPEAIKQRRARQIAHEINHLTRFQTGETNQTLLDFIIGEGLATYYEEHWNETFQAAPWREMVDQEQLTQAWQQAQPHLNQSTAIRGRWFNGSSDLPVGIGYVIGVKIIESYLINNPGAKMKDLVRLPSTSILEQSGFNT